MTLNIAFTPVGDEGNSPDVTGFGRVNYNFSISKYEINLGQYVAFLNAVAATPLPTQDYLKNLYSEDMNGDDNVIENTIARTGSGTASDPYRYSVAVGPADPENTWVRGSTPDDPVPFIDWFDAARFVNWLHNGASDQASTETGAYTLNGATSGFIPRNPDAKYWIPTENEWYKAAYFDPSLNDGSGGYWINATQSDSLPDIVNPPGTSNAANYDGLRPEQFKLIDGGSYSFSPSRYGTFDQAGNLWEWTGTNLFENYIVRGGSWSYGLMTVESSQRRDYKTDYNDDDTGFRVATGLSPYADLEGLKTPSLVYSLTAYEQISALYLGLLDRKADGPGFEYWLKNLASRPESSILQSWVAIAQAIGNSDEAKTKFTALARPDQATEADIHVFIDSIYQNYFSRDADPEGLAAWTKEFQARAAAGEDVGSIVISVIEAANTAATNNDHITVIRHSALGIPSADGILTAALGDPESFSQASTRLSTENSSTDYLIDRRTSLDLAFVPVLNAGNTPDTTGFGRVDYNFSIGKYEVTIGQYVAFLNTVLSLEPNAENAYLSQLYEARYMSNNRKFQDTIDRAGTGTIADPYIYTVSKESSLNDPVPWVSWYSAARFVNWLHNGADVTASTETGAYDLNGALSGVFTRTPDAKFWLPSENEWYKAAYFDPLANESTGGYWNIATGSDSFPENVNPAGGTNAANYNDFRATNQKLTPVGAYTYSPSNYGTYDQAGNLWEFLEASFQNNNIVRGGSWSYGYTPIENTTRRDYVSQYVDDDTGFRIATATSPFAIVDFSTGLVPHYALSGHEQISMLYLGLLGRKADGEGYQYWLNILADQPIETSLSAWGSIADFIGSSDEAKSYSAALARPESATQEEIHLFINGIYESLFSRPADLEGLEAWSTEFRQKAEVGDVGSIIIDIAAATSNGASSSDHLTLAFNSALGVPQAYPLSLENSALSTFVI